MQSLELDVDRLVTGLQEVTDASAATGGGLAPQAQVPTCPEWRVRDLVGHIGQASRWTAGLRRTRAAAPPPNPQEAEPGGPQDWEGWLRDSTTDLLGAFGETGPETPVWAFVGEVPARFWLRRMLADSTVHLADAAFAADREYTVGPDLAAETISEGLWLLSSPGAADLKPELAELRGDGQTLQLRATDVEPGWLITREPGGATWERRTADADVVVTASVSDLLLVFSRRTTPDDSRLTITGDRALLDHWWAHTAF